MVQHIRVDGRLELKTRRGKRHIIAPDDPHLRRANLIERLLTGWRFPRYDPADEPSA